MLTNILILYIVIGTVIALSPYYYLRKLNNQIEDGNYVPLKAYDLLLFNTVVETSGIWIRILIFLVILLFYPVIIVKYYMKYGRGKT